MEDEGWRIEDGIHEIRKPGRCGGFRHSMLQHTIGLSSAAHGLLRKLETERRALFVGA